MAPGSDEGSVRRRPSSAALPPVPPRPLAPLSAAAAAQVDSWSLAFAGARLEGDFAAHYARSMWRSDLAAILLHALFYCVLLFAPGPLGFLWWKLPLTMICRGMTYLAWLPVLLIPSLRRR